MELRQIEKNDYNLILELDAKVYPVTENKINNEIIDSWLNKYPKYGMIYTDNNNKIVAMSIAIPIPLDIWYKLIKGEYSENTLNIEWNEKNNIIGIHIYHIEVLNREYVGKGFYKRMLKDLGNIANSYNHQIEGLSGYCVTPKGNGLFHKCLNCKNADEMNKSITSEFIVENNKGQIKIINCPCNTDVSKLYLDNSIQPPQEYKFISKCNMLYTIKKDDINVSKVWEYLN